MGFQTTFAYDANGNVTKTTDANGKLDVEDLRRTEPGKLEVDAVNNATSYTYDLLGNITSITDANSHTTYFTYDDLGRLSRQPIHSASPRPSPTTRRESPHPHEAFRRPIRVHLRLG